MAKQTYESSIKRLEEIVGILEEGTLSLEESLKLFEEGSKLAAFCNNSLNNAEQKIVELSDIEKIEDKTDE